MIAPRRHLVIAAAVLAVAGCGEDRSGGTDVPRADAPKTVRDAPRSKVEFITPRDGATVGSKFTARVRLTNFVIDTGSIGKSPVPGRGHLHFQLDGGRFDIPEHSEGGKLAKSLGVDGQYSPAGKPEITYHDLPPGKHILEVYLANNNHTETGVDAEVEVTVR